MTEFPDDLVGWLRLQLDEDERAARVATDGPWRVDSEIYAEAIVAADGTSVVAGGRWGGEASVFEATEDALHIARWDPARVLREVGAKRWILDRYEVSRMRLERFAVHVDASTEAGTLIEARFRATEGIRAGEALAAVKLLALPYVDRPGYRQEWAP